MPLTTFNILSIFETIYIILFILKNAVEFKKFHILMKCDTLKYGLNNLVNFLLGIEKAGDSRDGL